MKNTSHDLTGKLESMVEPLSIFQAVSDKLSIPFVLVGATVRDIVMNHVYGISPERKTQDIDFAVMLQSWTDFTRLVNELINTGKFSKDVHQRQRLKFRDSLPIDMVPFGGIEEHNSITWPPEREFVMNTLGYQDAYESAHSMKISSSVTVKIASLPSLVMLKLFAWNDRPKERGKDLQDIHFLLRTYIEADNFDRLFEDQKDLYNLLVTDEHFGREVAGAVMLGRDLAAELGEETFAALINLVEAHAHSESRLVNDMAAVTYNHLDENKEESFDRLLKLWNGFLGGLRAR